jgi:hypothetical protein
MMILFYSPHCSSSKLLIENIKRYNADKYFKLVDVSQYKNKIPPQIHSVPALMFKETKKLIFGKQVFDYLLLPNKGFLLTFKTEEPSAPSLESPTDTPSSFSLFNNMSAYGDNYAFIGDADADSTKEKSYTWCSLTENIKIETPEDPNVEKGTVKKNIPDIATLKNERETEIKKYIPAII